jgi:hypothetical protein
MSFKTSGGTDPEPDGTGSETFRHFLTVEPGSGSQIKSTEPVLRSTGNRSGRQLYPALYINVYLVVFDGIFLPKTILALHIFWSTALSHFPVGCLTTIIWDCYPLQLDIYGGLNRTAKSSLTFRDRPETDLTGSFPALFLTDLLVLNDLWLATR